MRNRNITTPEVSKVRNRTVKLDDFVFDKEIELATTKVAPLFNMFGWEWHDGNSDGSWGVPNHNQIKGTIERLVTTVVREFNKQVRRGERYPEAMSGTGRLTVSLKSFEDEPPELNISLDLASESLYDEGYYDDGEC